MFKSASVVILLIWCIGLLPAQTSVGFFKPVPSATVARPTGTATHPLPQRFTAYELEATALQAVLATAPWENTAAARQKNCIITLPSAEGGIEEYAVWEVEMMEPALAARHPEVHTYAGESLRHPGQFVRMSRTARGFRAMILRPDFGVEYLEPYNWSRPDRLIAYDRKDLPADPMAMLAREWVGDQADLPAAAEAPFTPRSENRGEELDPVRLRVYRMIVSTTGEFAQDHGGTAQSVFSAVVEYTNLVSAIFERDIDLRLQLLQQSEWVIFLNPQGDPYTGEDVIGWMSQNPGVMDQYVGNANGYDIAHVYARYISGNAIGVAGGTTCSTGKARGCSAGYGGSDNYGDYFIGIIGQEVGHQMNGGHTWNRCNGTGGRAGSTAFEPGSGTTIMSYAGSCGSDNVQNWKDLYFHSGTIEEIRNFYNINGGSTCGTWQPTDNLPPIVTHSYQDNFYIPRETPFSLTGSGADPDGDALVFNWEQIDLGPETPLESPTGNAPLFRTWPAVSEPTRYFPQFSSVLDNVFDPTEQLPTNTRDMTFRLTGRDNRPGGGGVAWADVAFKATEAAGPFRVTAPNTGDEVWQVGEFVGVIWDVANTNVAPVNCQKVNILLSVDGGHTYPYTLAAGVANDGSQFVLVPDAAGSQARIRIDAADNIFYDLSNTTFTIKAPATPGFSLGLSVDAAGVCLPNTFTTNILSAGVLGFSEPATLSLEGALPPGATAALSAASLLPGETAQLTVDLSAVTVEGTFSFNVVATVAGSAPLVRPVTLTLISNDFSALTLDTPADGTTNMGLNQTLYWNHVADAETYDIQLASSPSFEAGTILATKTATTLDFYKIPFLLEKNRAYYWRVRPRNECGAHAWTLPAFFSTYVENCLTYSTNDVPLTISGNNTSTVESELTINAGGIISDLNVKQIQGNHTYFSDLEAHLISPQGTDVLLFKNKCGNLNGSFDLALDDAALTTFSCPPSTTGTPVKAQTSFLPLNGQDATGVWKLRVKDNQAGSGGMITAFKIEVCTAVAIESPYLVNNAGMFIDWGTGKAVTPDLLLVEDADNTHAELVYTLVTVPLYGELQLNAGNALQPGAQFTQADVDAGNLRYFHFGADAGPDAFRFTVADGQGGYFGTPQFVIQPVPVGTKELEASAPAFDLYPNPAGDIVWIAFGRPVTEAMPVRLFSTAGQLVRTGVAAAGSTRFRLAVSDLPRGLYLVQVGNAVRKLAVK